MGKIKNSHKSPPKGKPKSRSQYADPQRYKWPLDMKHIRAAVGYFNHGNQSNYSAGQWASIGRRIARAAKRLLGGVYRFAGGKIVTPNTAKSGSGGSSEEVYEAAYQQLLASDPQRLAALFADFLALGPDDADSDRDDALEEYIDRLLQGTPAQDGRTAQRATEQGLEEAHGFPDDVLEAPAGVIAEEVEINGVPCFRWEAMAIPADAISKNTVPGKRGPTYYSARRMRQYYSDNTRLLEELGATGQRVSVYPRHAAAMLDATLPLGWVEGYTLRPSASRAGAEDLWYTGAAPLSGEGAATRDKMRVGLVRFSSLRTFPAPKFQTEPIKLNGRVVEEATALPIAGIDLVATAPGLPVAPIRVLEEDAVIEVIEAVETVAPPQAPASPPLPKETPRMKNKKCPHCDGDIDDVVMGAVAAAQVEATEEIAALKHRNAARKKKLADVTAELEQIKAAQPAAAEEAAQALAQQTEIAELKARLTAAEEEVKALAEVKTQFATIQAREAIEAKAQEVMAGDKDQTFAAFLAPLLEEALVSVTDINQVSAIYWKLRAEQTGAYYRQRAFRPSGFGLVHAPAAGAAGATRSRRAASEERTPQPPVPQGQGQQQRAAEEDDDNDDDYETPSAATDMLRLMGSMRYVPAKENR